jgi:hypothetical protein
METKTVVAHVRPVSPSGAEARIKIGVPYASTHFTSTNKLQTVIKPVTGLKLTVPILVGANKRPPRTARQYQNKFIERGILYAVTREGVFPIFSLRDSVTVPTRVNIQRDIAPYATKRLEEELTAEIERAVP